MQIEIPNIFFHTDSVLGRIVPVLPLYFQNNENFRDKAFFSDDFYTGKLFGNGTHFFQAGNETLKLFKLTEYVWLNLETQTILCPYLQILELLTQNHKQNQQTAELIIDSVHSGLSLAIITLSDKGIIGLRVDKSGPLIKELAARAFKITHAQQFIMGDNLGELRALVSKLAYIDKFDLIITTGGTGVSPRDITPQALKPLIDLPLPGFSLTMLMKSLEKTPNAAISRSICGFIEESLVITLPGSTKAVQENLEAVLPAIMHTLKKKRGDPEDCGK